MLFPVFISSESTFGSTASTRAIRCYTKCGFRKKDGLTDKMTGDEIILMEVLCSQCASSVNPAV